MFTRAMLRISAVFAVERSLVSVVPLSVCLSVTIRYCVETLNVVSKFFHQLKLTAQRSSFSQTNRRDHIQFAIML